MNNIFNIYKGVPNPTQLVLAPRVNTDLSSAKIEIFNFQKTKVFGFTVGIFGGYFSSTLFEDKKVENIVDFRNFIANKKIQLVKYPDGVKIIYKDKIVHENEFVDDVKIIKINDLNLRVWSFRDNNYFDELLLE